MVSGTAITENFEICTASKARAVHIEFFAQASLFYHQLTPTIYNCIRRREIL